MPRFPLFTDNHIRQAIVDGFCRKGWDVVRAPDAFPQRTEDEVLFEYAAQHQRVFDVILHCALGDHECHVVVEFPACPLRQLAQCGLGKLFC